MHSVLTPVKHQTGTLLSEVEFAVEAARAYVRAKGRVKQEMQGFLQSNGGNHRRACGCDEALVLRRCFI